MTAPPDGPSGRPRRWRGNHRTGGVGRWLPAVLALAVSGGGVAAVAAGVGHPQVDTRGPDQPPGVGQAGGVSTTLPAGDAPPARPSAVAAVEATPEAMLYLLTALLPPGTSSRFAVFDGGDELIADLLYRRGEASGRVRVVLVPEPGRDGRPGPDGRPDGRPGPDGRPDSGPGPDGKPGSEGPPAEPCRPGAATPGACAILPNGATARLSSGADCRQELISEVSRRDGTLVRVEVDDCADPGGPATGDGDAGILDATELQLIAADDQWGRTMRADLVDAGRERFGDAPQIRDPFRPARQRLG